eukprot:1778704-Rhodomonas_salina.4
MSGTDIAHFSIMRDTGPLGDVRRGSARSRVLSPYAPAKPSLVLTERITYHAYPLRDPRNDVARRISLQVALY